MDKKINGNIDVSEFTEILEKLENKVEYLRGCL
jgi:hypothetical protein